MTRQIRLVQIGVGTVGRAVIQLVIENRERWRMLYGLEVGYTALLDTQGAVIEPDGLSDLALQSILAAKAANQSLAETPSGERASTAHVLQALAELPGVVLIDCGTGEGTADALLQALRQNRSCVLSNKAPLALDQQQYDHFHEVGGGRLWYEATVGAGLPVISTVRSLVSTGDEVQEITACASGTLGYITSAMMAGTRYSEAVRQAHQRGYTEPDPRDDLSGLDVARKALILARTFGRRLDLCDIRVEPLMPALDPSVSVEEFLGTLASADAVFGERVARARSADASLKYVATIPAEGQVTVQLREIPAATQMGSLDGPDNIFVFRTREYADNPLTVIGPGAGPTVTAMGVAGDILQAARQ